MVFALANPDPEIDPLEAQQHAAVVATGRSATSRTRSTTCWRSPGCSAGCSTRRRTEITDDMLLAAADAIADVVSPDQLNASYIVPSVFDENVARRSPGRGGGRPRRGSRGGAKESALT